MENDTLEDNNGGVAIDSSAEDGAKDSNKYPISNRAKLKEDVPSAEDSLDDETKCNHSQTSRSTTASNKKKNGCVVS